MQAVHIEHDLHNVAHSTLRRIELREKRVAAIDQAVRDRRFPPRVIELWEMRDPDAQAALLWLLQQCQYRAVQKERHHSARRRRQTETPPASGSDRPAPSSPQPPSSRSQRPSFAPGFIHANSTFPPSHPHAGATPQHSPFSPSTDPQSSPGPVWYAKDSTKPLSPAAALLYRAFIITKNLVTNRTSAVQVNEFPSHGVQGCFDVADWVQWCRSLVAQAGFDQHTQAIKTEDRQFTITSKEIWQSVCLLQLEDMVVGKPITGALKVNFVIIPKSEE